MFQDLQTSPLKVVLSFLGCQIIVAACADASGPAKSDAPATKNAKQSGTAAGPSLEHGAVIFKREMCVGCHAGGGNDLMPSKPIKGQVFARQYALDETLDKAIRKGFPDSGMPEFREDRITKAEMKDLILYIRSFTPKSE